MNHEEIGRKLHDRATRGGDLSPEERELLQRWYAEHDATEQTRLSQAQPLGRLAELQTQIEQVTARIVVQAQRIEALTAENAQIRQEVASLQRLLSAQLEEQPA